MSNLPCDASGMCMSCKQIPPPAETLSCKTCATPWHVSCISASSRPPTLPDSLIWDCPDCSLTEGPFRGSLGSSDLVGKIRAIQGDLSLGEEEKARLRQDLLSGKMDLGEEKNKKGKKKVTWSNQVLQLLDESFNCSFCMQLPQRPVTTPCGHNFCLKCFEKWVGQGKRTCAKCRAIIPPGMAKQPRINSTLVVAIRAAKMGENSTMSNGQPRVYHQIHNQDRPDKAFTTERAKKSGNSNAASGKIFVTIPKDFFGPITAEYDPGRNRGVLVGDTWDDRLSCRQWGSHFPHVAGIAGQSEVGAQSVALSGGYIDDEDHGEWFLYTGSGGRDLSGNKRTNKDQSFDQKFDKRNEALRLSCRKGHPVRVVRSFKEKRSAYAPSEGVRYDGIYRIEKCWRKVGTQGHKLCRYLFVRCDNEPAPWTSDDHGDRPRPIPEVKELDFAIDVTERKGSPSWDFDEEKSCWMWKKDPPASKNQYEEDDDEIGTKKGRRLHQKTSTKKKLLKEFSCLLCRKVMIQPLTTPCAHNFCKTCLEGVFAGQSAVIMRTCEGRRSLRAQKNVMRCPSCKNDITDFLQNPQVNRDMMNVIEKLQQTEEEDAVIEDVDGSDANHDESNKDTVLSADDSDEAEGDDNSDMSAEDGNKVNVNAAISKADKDEEKEGIAKVVDATKSEQELNQKNSKTDDNMSPGMSHEGSTIEVADSDPSDRKDEEMTAPADKVGRTLKRKNVGGSTCLVTLEAGRQTRSNKQKNVVGSTSSVTLEAGRQTRSNKQKNVVGSTSSVTLEAGRQTRSNKQVNRDMMNVIEKLQQTEKEDAVIEDVDGSDANHDESNKDTVLSADDSDEAEGDDNSDMSAEDGNKVNVNAAISKVDKDEEKEGIAKVVDAPKSEQELNQKNSKADDNVSPGMSPEESTIEVADSDPSDRKDEEMTAPADKVGRTLKRKNVGGSTCLVTLETGRQTRSNSQKNVVGSTCPMTLEAGRQTRSNKLKNVVVSTSSVTLEAGRQTRSNKKKNVVGSTSSVTLDAGRQTRSNKRNVVASTSSVILDAGRQTRSKSAKA